MEKQQTIIETTIFMRTQVLPIIETIKTYTTKDDILKMELKSIQSALTGESYLVEIDPSVRPIAVRLYHPETLKNTGYGTIRIINQDKDSTHFNKLNKKTVKHIKHKLNHDTTETTRDKLAKLYNVSDITITNIAQGKTWKGVTI